MPPFSSRIFSAVLHGDVIPDAYETAQDALSLRLYDAEAPEPSSRMEYIHAEGGDEIII